MKPLLEQYRTHLAQHSRDEDEKKLSWIMEGRIKSIGQFCLWERKMEDVISEAKTIQQRNTARANITLIRQVIISAAEQMLEIREAKEKGGANNKFNWRRLLEKPKRNEESGDLQTLAIGIAQEMDQLGTEKARTWKKIMALIDIWAGHISWFVVLRLSDLEILLEEIDSEQDEQSDRL